MTRSTNRSTLGASASDYPATVRNIALGTASVREANTLARVGPACPGVRVGRPGHTAAPTIVPVRGVLCEMPGEAEGAHPEAGAWRPGRRQPSRPGASRCLHLLQRVHPWPGRAACPSNSSSRPAWLSDSWLTGAGFGHVIEPGWPWVSHGDGGLMLAREQHRRGCSGMTPRRPKGMPGWIVESGSHVQEAAR